jgi:hypothetical protein
MGNVRPVGNKKHILGINAIKKFKTLYKLSIF